MTQTPRKIAAVLASHGDRAGASPNATLRAQTDAVRQRTSAHLVTSGVLKGDPTIEEAIAVAKASGADEILVYPLFMADGYFVKKVLRERVDAETAGRTASRILMPLGLDPALPALLRDEALNSAAREGFAPAVSRLLIVGHGSKLGPASANATRAIASAVRAISTFAAIETAFLEEDPAVEHALAASNLPTIVSGFFFGDGLHAGEDVPEAIAETGARAVYTGPIGNAVALPALIAASIAAAALAGPSG